MSLQEPVARNQLIIHSKDEFQRAGFAISDENIRSNSFDFIAKKTDSSDISSLPSKPQKIITKVLVDLDLFKKHTSVELQLISKLISGFPLLVASKSSGKKIEEATLYRRHDVSAISIKTLRMFLQATYGSSIAPKITKFAQRGGIYVNISKDRLKERRRHFKLDIRILAQKVGISRHALYKYERGESSPKITNYESLTNILGTDLDVPIDVLETKFDFLCEDTLRSFKLARSKLQKEVTRYLAEKEFDVLWFRSGPFDGLSAPISETSPSKNHIKDTYPIITGVASSDEKNDTTRIECINNLSHFLQKQAVWFKDDDDNNDQCIDLSKLITVNISDLERMPAIDFKKLVSKSKYSISVKNIKTNTEN